MFNIPYTQNLEEFMPRHQGSCKAPRIPESGTGGYTKVATSFFSHRFTVSGVSKEATTAWKEIFLYAKKVFREVKICNPNQPLLQISRIISEYFSQQTWHLKQCRHNNFTEGKPCSAFLAVVL